MTDKEDLLTGRPRLPGFADSWRTLHLGAIAVVTMGQSPAGSSYNSDRHGLPLVQGNADIRDRMTFDRIWTTAPTKICNAGDVLLTVRAPVGYTAVASRASCLGRGVCAVDAKTDNRFLFHALVHAEPTWRLYEQGSTFTAVNSDEVRSFPLNWPVDAKERSAIATVLDDADSYIFALERLITKKQAIRQGMMQELLTGRTRLPGFDDAWVEGPLKSFLPLQRGFDLPTSEVSPGPYPVVYSNGVSRTHVAAMAKGPGVVTGRSGTIGKVHYVVGDYWPHNTTLWVTSFSQVDPMFAYYFLTHLRLDRFTSGSGVPTFNRNDAHSFSISLPLKRAEQVAIADALSTADEEIELLELRLMKALDIKHGMMQELLTGRTRLPLPEEVS